MLHVISLGAGVQSTAMALMAAHGEITPMPDAAIFADTGAEPQAVYEHLSRLEKLLPFPVYRVSNGNLRHNIMKPRPNSGYPAMPLPAFITSKARGDGMVVRECTRQYKVRPIVRKLRELTGLTRKRAPSRPVVEQWIGISLDEAIRMKPSRETWIKHRWPLLELRLRRSDCLRRFDAWGLPRPAKSACTFCPYHTNDEWRALTPQEFADAVQVDRDIRNGRDKGQLFLHSSMKPLDQVDLSTAEERGQLNLFLNECEGMCGV